MDELIDILDENGNPTGRTLMKSEAHQNGLFHPTVHVWCYTANGRILVQQRAGDKATHPLLWDVSVAGHVGAGEDILNSAIREVREEIGLKIRRQDLKKIGVFKSVHKHGANLTDCEFHHTFLCELKVPLKSLKKQESEVAALALVPLFHLAEETLGLVQPYKYVPHNIDYYKAVLEAIKKSM